jgi:HAMP domain-containing protein
LSSKINELGIFDFPWRGQTQIACTTQIPQMQLSVMVFTPKANFFERAFDQYILLYIVYVAILLIGIFIVVSVSIWISRSLRQLSALMDEVSRGNLSVRFKPQAFGYEINLLGDIFNSTLGSIQTQMERAEDERVKRKIYEREVTLGREVQKSLFPAEFPKEEGIDLAGCYIPSDKVSGDFYLIEKHKAGLLVAMFDVGGKGIHSSLYALSVRSLLRTYATMIDDVGELMTRVNADFAAAVANCPDSITFLTPAISIGTPCALDAFVKPST